MKKTPAITLVELPPTVDGRLEGGISKDVYSLVKLPSRAIDLLAAICREKGFNDVAALNPSFNKRPDAFTPEQQKRMAASDVVGISSITRTAPQSYELADRVRAMNRRAFVIMGGPHVSALPEEALTHCDAVVMNEGDHTFVELLERLRDGSDISVVPGIAHKGGRTAKRAFLTNSELDALPFPVYPREVIGGITHTVINTSRGCPYGCDYCAVIENFGQKFRFLSVERTIELIEHTLAQTKKRIFFGDDNFTAVPSRAKRLMEEILRRGIRLPPWLAQVRVESAGDMELLRLMKRANCERVCIGFESADENALKLLNKHATIEKNTIAIERFHEAKISIHGMFIAGADTDTKETIAKTVEYARKMRIDTVQFLFITPLPGTKLTKMLTAEKRVITNAWHRYDGHHVLVRPKRMSTVELHEAMNLAWKKFYSVNEAFKHLFYGNEHWFNFMVRVVGSSMVRKIVREGSYYQRALASLESWYQQAGKEYGAWSLKVDALAKDVRLTLDEKKARAKTELDKAVASIKSKKDALDDLFASYKETMLKELERLMLERLASLAPA